MPAGDALIFDFTSQNYVAPVGSSLVFEFGDPPQIPQGWRHTLNGFPGITIAFVDGVPLLHIKELNRVPL